MNRKKVSELKEFEVLAEFKEKGETKKFLVSIKAHSASYAVDKVLSIIGSKHKKPRRMVLIKEVKEKKG